MNHPLAIHSLFVLKGKNLVLIQSTPTTAAKPNVSIYCSTRHIPVSRTIDPRGEARLEDAPQGQNVRCHVLMRHAEVVVVHAELTLDDLQSS